MLSRARHRVPLAVECCPTHIVHQANLAADLGQAGIGVVLPQLQAEFRPAGEHAVGLTHALADQVIHQHAQIGLVTPQRQWGAALGLQCSIGAGIQALRCRLFIPGGAVNLAGKKQPGNLLGFKTGFQRAWVKEVVLNGVTRPQDVGVLQPHHRPHRRQLDVKRQRGGDAVGVVLVSAQALGLQKDLVCIFVRKAVHLVLDAGAVAWAHALNHAGEHRAAVKPRPDDGVGACIGVGDPAGHLAGVLGSVAHEAEHRQWVQVTRLGGDA